MLFRKKALKAFTLTELMITILIIGILASFVIVIFSGSLKRSKDNRMISDVQVVSNALDQYAQAHARLYPLGVAGAPTVKYKTYGVDQLLADPKFKEYANNISIDPAYKVQYVVKDNGTKAMLVIPTVGLNKQTNSQCASLNTTTSAADYFASVLSSADQTIFKRAQICQLIVK